MCNVYTKPDTTFNFRLLPITLLILYERSQIVDRVSIFIFSSISRCVLWERPHELAAMNTMLYWLPALIQLFPICHFVYEYTFFGIYMYCGSSSAFALLVRYLLTDCEHVI